MWRAGAARIHGKLFGMLIAYVGQVSKMRCTWVAVSIVREALPIAHRYWPEEVPAQNSGSAQSPIHLVPSRAKMMLGP